MSKKTKRILGNTLKVIGGILFFAGLVVRYMKSGLPDTTFWGILCFAVGSLIRNYRKALSAKTKHMLLGTAIYLVILVITDYVMDYYRVSFNSIIGILSIVAVLGWWGLFIVAFERMEREAEALDAEETIDRLDEKDSNNKPNNQAIR